MDKLVYTAASGMKGRMAAQAAIANNIANASTTGFRAERVNFDALMVKGPGFDTRQPSSEEVTDMDRRAGAIVQTARPLDVAMPGEAWLAVQATDGSEAYTRRGDLQIAPSGVLQTGDGYPVMGSTGPITLPPAKSVAITEDGSVVITPLSGGAAQTIDKLKLAAPKGSDTVKGLDNLLHVRGGGALPDDPTAKVTAGALEQSNVNMTQALVDMIENQRGYEVQAQMLKQAKDMDESSASVMRLPG